MGQTYQVVISQLAEDSLQSIVEYLSLTASDTVAEKVRAGIIEEIRKLAVMPEKIHCYEV